MATTRRPRPKRRLSGRAANEAAVHELIDRLAAAIRRKADWTPLHETPLPSLDPPTDVLRDREVAGAKNAVERVTLQERFDTHESVIVELHEAIGRLEERLFVVLADEEHTKTAAGEPAVKNAGTLVDRIRRSTEGLRVARERLLAIMMRLEV